MSKPREFWIGTQVNDDPTWVSSKRPSGIRGAVCTGPDIHVIEKSAYDKLQVKLDKAVAGFTEITEYDMNDHGSDVLTFNIQEIILIAEQTLKELKESEGEG